MKQTVNCLLLTVLICHQVDSHGKVINPPNRSSLWRFGYPTPINYNDNQLFCGGFNVQYGTNQGKCGLCGDNYADPTPRDNEDGGKYGVGVVSKTYVTNGVIPVTVEITAAHKGYFLFSICNLDLETESEECFDKNKLKLVDGSDRYEMNNNPPGQYDIVLQTPSDLTCEKCVLRWHYTAGNNWGVCENGVGALGCGNQETFRTCSDISIKDTNKDRSSSIEKWFSLYRKFKLGVKRP